MTNPLAVLIVEDSESDAQLILRLLNKAGYDVVSEQVENAEEMSAALQRQTWDIVLSDYSLPYFDGRTALELLKEKQPDIPFIVISGTIGEETAVAMMKAGAHDYLIKGDLARLAPAVKRELEQAQDRLERKFAEHALLESEERWRRAVANSPIPIMIHDEDDRILQLSAGWTKFSGYTIEDIPTLSDWTERAYGERTGSKKEYIDQLFSIDRTVDNGQWIITTKDGAKRIWEFQTTPLGKTHKGRRVLHSMAIDITERRQAEVELQENQANLTALIENTEDRIWAIDTRYRLITGNRRFTNGIVEELKVNISLGQSVLVDNIPHELQAEWRSYYDRALGGESFSIELATRFSETPKYRDYHFHPIRSIDGTITGVVISGRDVTERKQAEDALRESESFTQAILKNSPIGISVRSRTGQLLSVNDAWKKVWAIPESDLHKDFTRDEPMLKFYERDDYLGLYKEDLRRVYEQGGHLYLPELKLAHPRPGAAEWVSQHFYAIQDAQGKVARVVILTEDITERKQAEDQLRQLSRAVEHSPASIMITDKDGKIEYVNPKFTTLTGYTLEDVRGETPRVLKSGRMSSEIYTNLWHTILTGKEWRGEILNRKKNGERYWEYASISAITDSMGNITHFVAVNEDITARKEAEEEIRLLNIELEHQALTDYLTNLNNRRYFMQRGAEEFKRAIRNSQPLSLLMLDIDEFKRVNDTYGHESGDIVLQQAGAAMKSSLRETDVLGRMGGEEFAVLLPNTSVEEAVLLAERMRATIATKPFETSGNGLFINITICIGVAGFINGMSNIEDLFRNADAALYHAKHNGRNRVKKFLGIPGGVPGLSSDLDDE